MTIRADEWLEVEIPEELMEEVEYYSDRGHGYKCGSVYELRVEQTVDYIMANPTSELAKNCEEEYGEDITNREALIRHINYINQRMGEEI
jgi:predicted ATP-dependent protease